MLKRLLALAVLAAAVWLVYRRLRPPVAELSLAGNSVLRVPGPSAPQPHAPPSAPVTDQPPPSAEPWPAPEHSPAPAEVAEQFALHPGHRPPAPERAEPAEEQRSPAEAAEQLAPEEPAAETSQNGTEAIDGYCMRCKQRRTMADVHIEMTDNGRRAARGTCTVCGAKMAKFLPTDADG